MLPKSRVLAILILGIGCVLLTAGLVLPKLVSADRPVPLDLADSELSVVDPAATVGRSYLATAKDSDPDVVTGAVTRRWAVGFGEPADEDSTAATVGVSTIREDIASSVGDDAGLLDAEVWSMRVDRNSGEVRQGDGDTRVADTLGSPAAAASVDGQWLKFPRHTKMQSYPFFDTLLRRAVAAEFTRSEELDGHEVYVFRQDMVAEPVQQSNPGYARLTQSVVTPGEGDRPGSSSVSTLHRSGSREISVEPSSGMIVSVREDLRDYYAAADGTETGVLLDFHGQTPDDQRAGLVDQAVSVGEGRPVGVWRLALTVIGAIVTVAAGIVALRPQRRSRQDEVGASGA